MTQGIAGIASLALMTSFIWTGPTFAGVRERPLRHKCRFVVFIDLGLEQTDFPFCAWELRSVALYNRQKTT